MKEEMEQEEKRGCTKVKEHTKPFFDIENLRNYKKENPTIL